MKGWQVLFVSGWDLDKASEALRAAGLKFEVAHWGSGLPSPQPRPHVQVAPLDLDRAKQVLVAAGVSPLDLGHVAQS